MANRTEMTRAAGLSLALCLAMASGSARANDLLSGEWKGAYSCYQGLTALTLSIHPHGERWGGTFFFGPVKGNKGVPQGAYSVTVTQDGDHFHFEPSGWIQEPPNYAMVGLDGTMSSNLDTLSGAVLFEGCQSFQVSRTTPLPALKSKAGD